MREAMQFRSSTTMLISLVLMSPLYLHTLVAINAPRSSGVDLQYSLESQIVEPSSNRRRAAIGDTGSKRSAMQGLNMMKLLPLSMFQLSPNFKPKHLQ